MLTVEGTLIGVKIIASEAHREEGQHSPVLELSEETSSLLAEANGFLVFDNSAITADNVFYG